MSWEAVVNKVDYINEAGHRQTAYLDRMTWNGALATGVHKHTDQPLVLRWDGGRETWTEVASTDAYHG